MYVYVTEIGNSCSLTCCIFNNNKLESTALSFDAVHWMT